MQRRTLYSLATAGLVTAAVVTGTAWAAWSRTSNAAATVTVDPWATTPPPAAAGVTAVVRHRTVTLSWPAARPRPQRGYEVERRPSRHQSSRPGGGCDGLVRETTCTVHLSDRGRWQYRVRAVDRRVRGPWSPWSHLVTVPGAAAPTAPPDARPGPAAGTPRGAADAASRTAPARDAATPPPPAAAAPTPSPTAPAATPTAPTPTGAPPAP